MRTRTSSHWRKTMSVTGYKVNEVRYDDADLYRVRGAAYRKGFREAIWTGVIWTTIAFVLVLTAATFYTPNGFC